MHCSLLKKGSDSVSPSIQIDLPIPLRIHIVTHSDLSKLLAAKHPQTLSELPGCHPEMITIGNVS